MSNCNCSWKLNHKNSQRPWSGQLLCAPLSPCCPNVLHEKFQVGVGGESFHVQIWKFKVVHEKFQFFWWNFQTEIWNVKVLYETQICKPFLSASIQGSNTYFWCVVTNELLMMDSILPRSADERDTHSHALKPV